MLEISSDEDSAEYDKYPATVGVKVASREDMLAELDPRPKRGKKLFDPFKDSVGEMMVHPLSPPSEDTLMSLKSHHRGGPASEYHRTICRSAERRRREKDSEMKAFHEAIKPVVEKQPRVKDPWTKGTPVFSELPTQVPSFSNYIKEIPATKEEEE